MSDERTEADARSIEEKLRQAWRQEQRFYHLRGLSRFLIWAVSLVLLDFAVDTQILFPARISGAPQQFMALAGAGILLWVLWREWFRHLKPYDPVHVSLEVESKHPELRSVLVSFIQFKDKDAEAIQASPALLEAMRNQAFSLTRPLDFREVVDFRQLRNLFLVACGFALIFGGVSYNWSNHVRSLFLRMAGNEAPYPTETAVVSVTGDLTVKAGSPAEILVKVSGEIPDEGELLVRAESGGGWRELVLSRDGDAFVHTLSAVTEKLTYFAKVGDAVSEQFEITVSPRPQVVKARVTLSYPEYLGKNGADEPPGESLNLTVPAGSTVRWELTCSPPLRALTVESDLREDFNATLDETGTVATFELEANATFKYAFRWFEKEHGFEYDDLWRAVRVTPDRIPEVKLIEPAADGVATPNMVVNLLARATDDHRLHRATLVYSVSGEEKRIDLGPLDVASKNIGYEWKLSDDLPDLKPRDVLTFAVEVSDNLPPLGSHINVSATRKLEIKSPEDYLNWFEEQYAAQVEAIVKARDLERKARAEVSKLKAEEGDEPIEEENEERKEEN